MNNENSNNILRNSIKKVKFIENNKYSVIQKVSSLENILSKEKAINIIKQELDEKLLQLFSSKSSASGYRHDIESLLKDMHINKEDLFKIVLEFLSKSTKKENEIRIIACYLFSMQGLTNLLLKTIDSNNKEQNLLNDLLALSNTLVYEKFQKNYVLIRFGEKGSKAYINLSGQVAVLIKKEYKLLLTEEEYLYYLANLINYNEYELANLVINENYKSLPIEIIDDINEQNFSKQIISYFSFKNIDKFNNNINDNLDNSFNFEKKSSKIVSYFDLNKISDNIKKKKYFPKLKLNQENEKLKELSPPSIILASKLIRKSKLKLINKKLLNKCSVEEYINRINVIKDFDFNEDKYNNKHKNNKDKSYFSIYSYINVVNLKVGSLFGEMALNNKNSLRNATIITLDDCHCGVLNKKTYINCLKNGAEKNLQDILYFIVGLPIFKGIPSGVFFRKYFTSLSHNSINKNHKIIIQGEKPEHITLLQSGQFTIYTFNSLYNITNLMIYYMKNNPKIKANIIMNKLILSLKSTNKLLIQNEEFKKYYFSKNKYKIGEISCPDIIGYNEYLDQTGNYAFSIELKSIKSDIYLLKNEFYEDIIKKNEIVRNNQNEFYLSKLDLIIERLYNMRKIAINNFLEYKTKEEIGKTINKEIDNVIDNNIKYKRTKKLNLIDYNISVKQNDKNNIKNEINYLDFNKKANIFNNMKYENKISAFNLKKYLKTDNNINKCNNLNKNEKQNNNFNIIDKIYNKTITYFRNYNLSSNKYKKEKKQKIENYSEKNKKNNFDAICLNNMILEDIKEQIKFPFLDKEKIFNRNTTKRRNILIISRKIYKSVKNKNIKKENENSFPSLSEEYFKTLPLFRSCKDTLDKKIETNNKIENKNKIFNLKQKEETKYDIERNNYYMRNINRRIKLFYGNKKK